jgi:hypothetical protein
MRAMKPPFAACANLSATFPQMADHDESSGMEIIEEHRTPDGLFRFIVERSDTGDLSLGFDGFAGHTHGDILASLAGVSIEVAVRRYIDALLAGKSLIAVARVGDKIRDVWVTDDLRPDKHKPDDETIYLRYWDGRPALSG